MNTNQIKYLIELSQHNSMTAASEKLFITSQALSIAIKKLEDELGFPLLNRSYKGISLTDDGLWMVQFGQYILNEIEQRKQMHGISSKAFHPGSLEVIVNVLGMGSSVLSQLIGLLYQQEPEFKIYLNEIPKEDVLQRILQEKNEFGFVFRTRINHQYIDVLDDSLIFEPLFYGKHVAMANPIFDFTKLESTSFKKIVNYPICFYSIHNAINNFHNLLTNVLYLECNETVESNFDIFRQKLLLGLAITISIQFQFESVPSNYIDGLTVTPLRDNIRIDFGMVKKKDTILSEHAQYFMDELRKFVDQLKSENSMKPHCKAQHAKTPTE